MQAAFTIVYVIHMLSIFAILFLLLRQWGKNPKKLSKGVPHSAASALVAGIALVGLYSSAKPDEEINHTKIGIKLLISLTVVAIAYVNIKKPVLSKNIWIALISLPTINILIAYGWR